MYITPTTAVERVTIANAVETIFDRLEQAQTILDTVLEDCFMDAEQHSLSQVEAEWLGTMLRISNDILYDCIREYYLTVTPEQGSYANQLIESAERVKDAIAVENAANALSDIAITLPCSRRAAILKARQAAQQLPDAEAIVELKRIAEDCRTH